MKLIFICTVLVFSCFIECKLVWKKRPKPIQIVNEYDDIELECQFQEDNPSLVNQSQYFVIWYRDGSSQNVLSLNDKLANLDSTNYQIVGKYNLLIKNVSKANSGLYTCQLFQSNDLISSVNLTVLVSPKYAEISVHKRQTNLVNSRDFLVEGDKISLECCTNADMSPGPQFKWTKTSRANPQSEFFLTNSSAVYTKSHDKLCSVIKLSLSRTDNDFYFNCAVGNEAFQNKVKDKIVLSVEHKPQVRVHLFNKPSVTKLKLIENSTINLFCNASAIPNRITYQWYLNDMLLQDQTKDNLLISNLKSYQHGNYICKANNKHGSTNSLFNIEVLYAKIGSFNQSHSYAESFNLKQSNAKFVNTFENSSLALMCEIDANPLVDQVEWFFYRIEKENKINRIRIKNGINGITRSINQTQKLFFSQLNLVNVNHNQSGYYSCVIRTKIHDDLGRKLNIVTNSTYYLQVQYPPIVRAVRKTIFANNYDQVQLICDIKSNPQSIFSWFYGNKELNSNYKYNITNSILSNVKSSYLDDFDNVNHYQSVLIVNSLTQFDYGDYSCRANNVIGENRQILKIKKKQKPEVPTEFKVVTSGSNNVILSWMAGSNGGENSTFLITINNSLNITTLIEEDLLNEQDDELKYNQIEIKGLQSQQDYDFKLLAFNSWGMSDFTEPIKATTLPSELNQDQLPNILNAQFNEIREAICFEIEQLVDKNLKLINPVDLVVKIDISSTEDNSSHVENTIKKKSYLLNLSKLKFGQNCISFSQLIELDWEIRNSTFFQQFNLAKNKESKVFSLDTNLIINRRKFSSDISLGRNFDQFKYLNSINLSICYSNDSSVCSFKTNVKDYTADVSTYVTLIAVGCSAVIIFFALLISMLCCCCCRKHRQNQNKGCIKKSDLNSKLVIKSFPIVSNHFSSYDLSESSYKSSQQQILNGSGSTHSSGSSTFSRTNEKYFYQNSHVYNFGQTLGTIKNAESDTVSSSSLENKTASTSNGKSPSNNSPVTVESDNQIFNYSKPKTLFYNGSNSICIKTYQQQNSKNDNSDSGFTTPVNATNNTTLSKKLVYEVIV